MKIAKRIYFTVLTIVLAPTYGVASMFLYLLRDVWVGDLDDCGWVFWK